VVHAHTGLSHDSQGSVEEILAAARAAKLDFLVTTDHYTPRIFTEGVQGLQGSVLVLRGLEAPLGCTRGTGIARRCGSVLTIGLQQALDPGAFARREDLFAAIRAQGALSIVAHPRGVPDRSYYDLADGMEIYDIADVMRDRIVDAPRYLLDFAMAHAEYQEEVLLPIAVRANWHLAQWDLLTRTRRLVGLAGNDAHQNLTVFGHRVDPYDAVFRAVNTHILASSLSAESLVEALRAGRCFASFNLLADANGFQCVVRDGETGPVIALMGDEVSLQEGLVLEARTPVPSVIELFRDGTPIRRLEGRHLRHAVDRPGVYRVELSLRVLDRVRPWVLGNPVYIRRPLPVAS
jgi:predicted metal-dependent phosphoesterase TrpH